MIYLALDHLIVRGHATLGVGLGEVVHAEACDHGDTYGCRLVATRTVAGWLRHVRLQAGAHGHTPVLGTTIAG